MKKYKVGDIVECQVTGIVKYGVFVNVDFDYSGLIHISEVAHGFVRNIEDYVKEGETIFAEVIAVDNINFHLRLSIKNIDYKRFENCKNVLELGLGFEPLSIMLPEWTKEKIEEFSN